MKSEILIALRNSLIGDTLTLRESNNKLLEMSWCEGYCFWLMEIIDEPSLETSLKQAALVQLKNNIKGKWKPKNEMIELKLNEKNQIKNALILAIARCSNNYLLIKIYKDILTIIISHEFETWLPLGEILFRMESEENLSSVFHCMIAICTNFEYVRIEKEKVIFYNFLNQTLPNALKIVAKYINNAELLYLSLKMLWKVVHYDIDKSIKILVNPWMELILFTIVAYNEEMQGKLEEVQSKNTPEFYYYHSKKWATRILLRFIQKHAKINTIYSENIEFSKFWYESFGIKLCEAIAKHLELTVPTTKKIRFFQLKIIHSILQDQPELIIHQSKIFQYDILLNFMAITYENERMAKHNVVEYLRNEDENHTGFTSVKNAAIEVWKGFMQFKSKREGKDTYIPGPLFEENVEFMFAKIEEQNLINKELGMLLFCENKAILMKVPAIKAQIQDVLDKYVLNELTNSEILIRARANDMVCQFGKYVTDFGILARFVEAILRCLTEDESHLVKIKASFALNSILSNKDSKQLLQPYLKIILEEYLKLIEQYDLEQVVAALEHFISDFEESIGPYAIDLFKFLLGTFIKMFHRDIELNLNEEYESEIEHAALGCIKAMTQILESPLDSKTRLQLEPEVLSLCSFIFTQKSIEYIENLMYLMRVHLERILTVSHSLWFYYQVIIYFVVGIPESLWGQVETSVLSEAHKAILFNIKSGSNLQFLPHAMLVLRNYFNKGYNMITTQREDFKNQFLQLIFYFVSFVYKNTSSDKTSGEVNLECSCMLLVYLVETFPSEMIKSSISFIWGFCKYNIDKARSLNLKKINVQLLSVILWKHASTFLEILDQENQLNLVIQKMCRISPSLEEIQERKRVILGICSYFDIFHQNYEILRAFAPSLIKILLKMVRRNLRSRILLSINEPNLKEEFEKMQEESDEEIEEFCDDLDDFWDEEYNQMNVSLLREINELEVFKMTMEKIAKTQTEFCEELLNTVSKEVLNEIECLFEQVISIK